MRFTEVLRGSILMNQKNDEFHDIFNMQNDCFTIDSCISSKHALKMQFVSKRSTIMFISRNNTMPIDQNSEVDSDG